MHHSTPASTRVQLGDSQRYSAFFPALGILFAIGGGLSAAYGTSEIAPAVRKAAAANCELEARFVTEARADRHVYWNFRRVGGACDDVGTEVSVRIPPGQYVSTLEKYSYPEFIVPPEEGATYRLRLVFFGTEPQFADWRTGWVRVR